MAEHREIQELLGVYALDAVDPETAARVERHLSECVKCSIEVAQHHEVAGLLANSGGESPAGLWDGIATQIDGSTPPSWDRLAARLEPPAGRSDRAVGGAGDRGEDQDPGGHPTTEGTVVSITASRRSRWVRSGAIVAAAAAAIIALVFGLQVHHLNNQVNALQAQPGLSAAEQAALQESTTKQVLLTSKAGPSTGPVTVVLTASGTGFVEGHQLDPLPSGKTYQLWGVIGGRTISLGLLGRNPSVVPFSVAGDGSVQAFAITAEHAGGVIQSQNQPVVAGEVTA